MPRSQTPNFAEILTLAIANAQSRIWTALPGVVTEYDEETQRAFVQPLVGRVIYDENDERQTERLPVIGDVPVMFQRAGSMGITFPIETGNVGLLVFTSCSLDKWFAGDGSEVRDPGFEHRNHLSDAVFIPGLFALSPPTSAPTNALVVHGTWIKLGGDDADDPVVRKSDLDAVVARLEGHKHPLPTLSGAAYNPNFGADTTDGPEGSFTAPACSTVVRSK